MFPTSSQLHTQSHKMPRIIRSITRAPGRQLSTKPNPVRLPALPATPNFATSLLEPTLLMPTPQLTKTTQCKTSFWHRVVYGNPDPNGETKAALWPDETPKRKSFVQAVLYGVEDPDTFDYSKSLRGDGQLEGDVKTVAPHAVKEAAQKVKGCTESNGTTGK
ncbi:hypothetical protein EJ04DRAFT_520429 [Polyplosphaeria fusca]|uniref:Uncharacterized protein n=1 Tax=Polyplosphaeria fusca TaxID=682080 RepID=A0A9P4R8N7_9PLEO|nr:hypothetical protein EJ04DRAFT_520429 [Polyplosphaeria fusca]